MTFTPADKLAAVETAIEALRWARADDRVPEHRQWLLLKAVASDIRGRMDAAPSVTLDALAFRIDAARRGKARLGYYDIGQMQGIAEELIGRWPAVRQALEAFAKETAS